MHAALTRGPLALLALALAVTTLARPAPILALANLPDGVSVGTSSQCNLREGGYAGFRIDPKFEWYYSDGAPFGSAVTISGTYTLQTHNPTSGKWDTIFSDPYGFELQAGSTETRDKRYASGDPHAIFDQVRLETTWQIDTLGLSGTESSVAICTIEPAPIGQQPLTDTPGTETKPGTEVFVNQADPSPMPEVSVTSSLYCERGGRGNVGVTWGMIAANDGAGGSDGVLVSGVLRASTRGQSGDYSQVQEQPFALWMLNSEQTAVDGHVDGRDLAAAKIEIEWRVNVGTAADSGAPLQKILRTTACT